MTNNERGAGRKPLKGERRSVTLCGLTPEAASYLDNTNKAGIMTRLINDFVERENETARLVKKMELRDDD